MEIVETEIIISDLEIVEDRLNKLDRLAKVSKEKGTQERELLLRVKATLERSSFVNMEEFDHSEKEMVYSFNLITTKPIFYVANIDEENLGDLPIAPLEEFVRSKGSRLVYICGKLEQDLINLSMDERNSYMDLYDGDVHREGDQGRLRDAWPHHLLHDSGERDEGLDNPPEHNLCEGCRQDTL
jgi:ribosome-binding ATPase YchF (GTP1/OBG family)